MKLNKITSIFGLSLLTAGLMFTPACGDDDDTDTDTGAASESNGDGDATGDGDAGDGDAGDGDSGDGDAAGETNIRVMHLGVNVPGVDVFANETEPAAFTGLEFRNSTAYAALPPADYTFDVSVADTGLAASVLQVGPLSLEDGVSYTAVAVGNLNNADVEVVALVDDRTDIGDNIRVQVMHAASGVGQVDIWNVTDPANPAPLLENVDYKAAATLNLPVADYAIGIDVNDDAMPDLVFEAGLATIGLPAGAYLNVYASDDADENVALVAQLDDGTTIPIPPM